MSPAATPKQLLIAEYFELNEVEKFSFMEENLDRQTEWAIRNTYLSEATMVRNIDIAEHCYAAGVELSSMIAFFGYSDHIGRAIRTGKASDEVLVFMLKDAEIDPEHWMLCPREYHNTLGMRKAVMSYRHLSKTSLNPVVKVTHRTSLKPSATAARIGTEELSLPHTALMRAICQDQDVIDEWLHHAVYVMHDFRKLSNSPSLVRFLRQSHEIAQTFLNPNDKESLKTLASWEPDAAPPETVLGEIALIWNSYQVYWHFVQDTLTTVA